MTEISAELVREVFGNADTRVILLTLAHAKQPLQYSKLREQLDMHPQAFKRSLDRLEHHGLVGRIYRGKPNNLGRRAVFLEPTVLGSFWADQWKSFQKDVEKDATKRRIPRRLLEAHQH